MAASVIDRWHEVVRTGDPAALDAILDEEVVFHSPVVHTPQRGKTVTSMYLASAMQVFRDSEFAYVREIVGERDAVLEFVATIDGIHINGVDMIRWNSGGRIVDFKVLVRPLKAVNMLHRMMAAMLEQMSASAH
jgi:hypothetical protein